MPMVGENPPADSNTWGIVASCSCLLSSSSSIILRSSCGSVPSTASMSDFLRNGSSIFANSESSDTMPSRRALFAYLTISAISVAGSRLGSRKMCASLRNAESATGRGNWMSTAPMVPPNTIMAAVGCKICPRLPPSSNKPARIPPTASSTPPNVALSKLLPLLVFAGFFLVGQGRPH